MRQVVHRVFLYETSPALKTNCIAVAEWDAEARRFYVGDLCLPESAAKEWIVTRPAPVEPKPEASTPTPAPIVRKGPSRK
jgi:hypothetical protein